MAYFKGGAVKMVIGDPRSLGLLVKYPMLTCLFYTFHPLQVEHQETGVKLQECWATDKRCNGENARMRQRIGEMEGRNAELRRRLADAQKYKEQVL